MSVNLGGNDIFRVPFPLVLADRFFNIYRNEGLIRQDRSAAAGRGLVFRLTKNGKERVAS